MSGGFFGIYSRWRLELEFAVYYYLFNVNVPALTNYAAQFVDTKLIRLVVFVSVPADFYAQYWLAGLAALNGHVQPVVRVYEAVCEIIHFVSGDRVFYLAVYLLYLFIVHRRRAALFCVDIPVDEDVSYAVDIHVYMLVGRLEVNYAFESVRIEATAFVLLEIPEPDYVSLSTLVRREVLVVVRIKTTTFGRRHHLLVRGANRMTPRAVGFRKFKLDYTSSELTAEFGYFVDSALRSGGRARHTALVQLFFAFICAIKPATLAIYSEI
jgi:hypothetical protein